MPGLHSTSSSCMCPLPSFHAPLCRKLLFSKKKTQYWCGRPLPAPRPPLPGAPKTPADASTVRRSGRADSGSRLAWLVEQEEKEGEDEEEDDNEEEEEEDDVDMDEGPLDIGELLPDYFGSSRRGGVWWREKEPPQRIGWAVHRDCWSRASGAFALPAALTRKLARQVCCLIFPSRLSIPPSHSLSGCSLRPCHSCRLLPSLPCSPQGGAAPINGITYRKLHRGRMLQRAPMLAWRAAVDAASTISQLALTIRQLDTYILWEDVRRPSSDKEPNHPLFKVRIEDKRESESAAPPPPLVVSTASMSYHLSVMLCLSLFSEYLSCPVVVESADSCTSPGKCCQLCFRMCPVLWLDRLSAASHPCCLADVRGTAGGFGYDYLLLVDLPPATAGKAAAAPAAHVKPTPNPTAGLFLTPAPMPNQPPLEVGASLPLPWAVPSAPAAPSLSTPSSAPAAGEGFPHLWGLGAPGVPGAAVAATAPSIPSLQVSGNFPVGIPSMATGAVSVPWPGLLAQAPGSAGTPWPVGNPGEDAVQGAAAAAADVLETPAAVPVSGAAVPAQDDLKQQPATRADSKPEGTETKQKMFT